LTQAVLGKEFRGELVEREAAYLERTKKILFDE